MSVQLNRTSIAEFFKGIDSLAKDALSKAKIIDVPMLDPRAMEHVAAASVPCDFEKDTQYSFVMRGKVRYSTRSMASSTRPSSTSTNPTNEVLQSRPSLRVDPVF